MDIAQQAVGNATTMRQAEDGIKAIYVAAWRYFVSEGQTKKPFPDAHIDAQRVHLGNPVDDASSVAHGDAVAGSEVPRPGFFFDGRQYFLVDGQRLYPFDALRVHGVVSELDESFFCALAAALNAACRKARESAELQAAAVTFAAADEASAREHVG